MSEVDAVALYHYKLKVAYEDRVRKRFGRTQGMNDADAEDEVAAELVNGVVKDLSFGELVQGDADDLAAEETDSEDESSDEGQLPSLAQTEFDNSILRMGRALLSAAKENPAPGSNEVPSVTLRLTRLDPNPEDRREHDARISRTVDELRAMGIDVRLGELDDSLLSNPPDDPARHTRPIHPTHRINLF